MTCRDLIGFLDAYVAGELPSGRRAEFDRHLSVCPPCVAYLKSYEKTIGMARTSCLNPDDPIPEDVPPKLLEAIRAALKKKKK